MELKRKSVPMAIIGWALFGGWPLAAFMTSALLPSSPAVSATISSLFWPLSLGCVCIAMIALAIGNEHAERWIAAPHSCGICSALLVASCAVLVAANQLPLGSTSFGLGIVGAALSGISSGFLHIAWQRVLMELTWNQLDVLIPLGYGGSLAVGFATSAIPPIAGTILLFGSLTLSGIALVRITRDFKQTNETEIPTEDSVSTTQANMLIKARVPDLSTESQARSSASQLLPRTWIATALIVVTLWIPIVFAEDSVVAERSMANRQFLIGVGAGIAASLLFSYGAYIYAQSAGMRLIARLTIPLAILALATLCFAPADWLVIAYILAFTANTIMHIFLHLASVSLAKRSICGIVLSSACILMPLYAATLISSLINPALCQINPADVSFVTTALLLLVVTFALPYSIGYRTLQHTQSLAGIAVLSPNSEIAHSESFENSEYSSDVASNFTRVCPSTQDTPDKSECSFEAVTNTSISSEPETQPEPLDAIQAIITRYGLTQREAEVFELFAAGRDSGYIREKLYISRDTVHTHLKHIYQKLGIHSKREMFDMVEHEQV